VDGRTEWVRPQDIRNTALLTVEGELDDISGSGQTAAAHDLCKGIDSKHRKHLEVPGAGHYGIFSGRRWRDIVYPQVRQFILAHAAAAAKPAARKSAAKTATKPVVARAAATSAKTARRTPAKTAAAPAKRAKGRA
jgi:poly(3-hydroxybutyrate) depolymerase